MHARDLDLVVIGDGLVTLTTDEPLATATSFSRDIGGDAVLAAVEAAHRGRSVALVTRVGDDAFGDWLLSRWEREGLHLDAARRCRGRNAVVIHSRADGQRTEISYREGGVAAGLDASDLASVPWRRARLLFTSGATQSLGPGAAAAVVHGLEAARAASVTTVYDPALRSGLWPDDAWDRARRAFDEVAELLDVLVIAAPFATAKLLGEADATAAAREARRRGIPACVVRDGQGAVVASGSVAQRVGGRGRREVTAQARFAGALAAGLAAERPLAEAAREALTFS